MKNELATTQKAPSALAVMASKINVDPAKLHSTLKSTVFKGASDDELLALVVVANTYGLNPLLKELYAFPAKGGGIVPVVSVDGWVSMVNGHPQMDGMEFEERYSDDDKLEAITCRIWRKDRNRPISVTEHMSECKRNTDPWKMEHRMLRHKALMQCARYAFGFSGITDEDEAVATPGLRNVTPERPVNMGEVIDPFANEARKAAENTIARDAKRKADSPATFKGHAGGVYVEGKPGPQDIEESSATDLANMPDAPWGDEQDSLM